MGGKRLQIVLGLLGLGLIGGCEAANSSPVLYLVDQSTVVVTTAPATMAATQSADPVDATDAAAVKAAIGKDVTVTAKVAKAAWSSSGKVCTVEFVGSKDTKFYGVIFQKDKDAVDAGFGGDFVKAIQGATLKVKGKPTVYTGSSTYLKDRIQLFITKPDQVEITEKGKVEVPATTKAAE